MDLHKLILKVMPPFRVIRSEANLLRMSNPAKSPKELSRLNVIRVRNKYAAAGAASALPSAIPGLGTITQIAIETGAASADVALMLRWMASLCYATALIYGKDIEDDFEDEFTVVLGIWAGVVVPEKAAEAKGERLSVNHFDKHITDRIRNRMNQRIGRKLVTKYGSKRGGAALGRLIPFGIGAVVGGTFNYFTLEKFGKAADDYFGKTGGDYVVQD